MQLARPVIANYVVNSALINHYKTRASYSHIQFDIIVRIAMYFVMDIICL